MTSATHLTATRFAGFVLLALLPALAHAAATCPADIVLNNGRVLEDVEVITETMDAVRFLFQDAEQTIRQDQVRSVEYSVPNRETSFFQAQGSMNRGDWVSAIGYYNRAARSQMEYVRVNSLLGMARAQANLDQHQQALESLQQLLSSFPNTVYLGQALSLRGRIQVAAGDMAGASETFRRMGSNRNLGVEGEVRAGQGQALIHRTQRDYEQAARTLAGVIERLDVDRHPVLYAEIANDLAGDYLQAGQTDQARAVYERLLFVPAIPDMMANAHVSVARMLSDDENASTAVLVRAFDHALLALQVEGASGDTTAAASSLARTIGARLVRASDLSAAEREEFQRISQRL